jgi:hypothetical protein
MHGQLEDQLTNSTQNLNLLIIYYSEPSLFILSIYQSVSVSVIGSVSGRGIMTSSLGLPVYNSPIQRGKKCLVVEKEMRNVEAATSVLSSIPLGCEEHRERERGATDSYLLRVQARAPSLVDWVFSNSTIVYRLSFSWRIQELLRNVRRRW